jgi:exodeoxyribonuclease-3
MERLRKHAAELLAAERPTVLAGDYNVIPEDRDTFSRRAMADDALFQPESQAAFRRIVNQGWTDALRALRPNEEKLWTFWDYQAGAWQRDAGFRIDHLLCSPQAADRLRGAEVHKWARAEEKASDHAPVAIGLAD